MIEDSTFISQNSNQPHSTSSVELNRSSMAVPADNHPNSCGRHIDTRKSTSDNPCWSPSATRQLLHNPSNSLWIRTHALLCVRIPTNGTSRACQKMLDLLSSDVAVVALLELFPGLVCCCAPSKVACGVSVTDLFRFRLRH